MKHYTRFISISTVLLFCITVISQAQITVTPDHIDGIYQVGDTVKWDIEIDSVQDNATITYTLKKGGLIVTETGALKFEDNHSTITYPFDQAGSVILVVQEEKEEDNEGVRAVGGAITTPSDFKLSSPKPKDFDYFWAQKIEQLKAIPKNTVLEPEDSEEGISYSKIYMDNINGTRIQGQIAKPSEGDSFPALLIVQWAGIYPLQKQWVTDRAKAGWLVLNINPHDLPIDKEQSYYHNQWLGELGHYWSIGNDYRDKSYYLRMYLSCYRAAQYLTERPDWNGKTLVVMGTSQGGQQAVMTAGLHPDITACLALVPAGFDMLGPEAGRKGGWPQWYSNTEDKNPARVHETSRYFDVANFVPNISCPVLVGVGLLDEVCPPEGILAGINQMANPAQIIILTTSGHQNVNDSQQPYSKESEEVWLPLLFKGGG